MATVHIGRLLGPSGFSRTVAIKQLHPQFAKDPDFAKRFLDEARLAARISHPNVVPTLDIVALDRELFVVMDYDAGESLASVMRCLAARGEAAPPDVMVAILIDILQGLAAAHLATSDQGTPLHIVHRDVSPQNILVGINGLARLADFGVAKAAGRLSTTSEGEVRGKLAYMAPEQVRGRAVDARTDVYASAVVLWEALTGARLFDAPSPMSAMTAVLEKRIPAPSTVRPGIPAALDAVVLRGLARDPERRYSSAEEMIGALERAHTPATSRAVRQWLESVVGERLRARADQVAAIEKARPEEGVEADAAVAPPSEGALPPASSPSPAVTWRAPYLALAAALVTVVALLLLLSPSRRAPEVGADALAVATSVATTPAAAPSASAAPPPSASIPTTSASARSAVLTSAGGASAGPRHKAPSHADCSPPYTLDADGIRHAKPRCL